jgi:hypothetical protein
LIGVSGNALPDIVMSSTRSTSHAIAYAVRGADLITYR